MSEEIDVVIIGRMGCGKLCLVTQFIEHRFIGEIELLDSIHETNYRTLLEVDGVGCRVEMECCDVVDDFLVSGEFVEPDDQFPSHSQLLKNSKCVMIVYDITSRESFQWAPVLHKKMLELRKNANSFQSYILVGTKRDLEEQRVVSTEDGRALAESWGCHFFEITAKNREEVVECFTTLVRVARKSSNDMDDKHDKHDKHKCLVM